MKTTLFLELDLTFLNTFASAELLFSHFLFQFTLEMYIFSVLLFYKNKILFEEVSYIILIDRIHPSANKIF